MKLRRRQWPKEMRRNGGGSEFDTAVTTDGSPIKLTKLGRPCNVICSAFGTRAMYFVVDKPV